MAAAPSQPGASAMRVTLAAALVPGLGHLLLGRRLAGALYLMAAAGVLGLAGVHFAVGIDLLDASFGSFLLGTALRNAAVLHAFSVIDAYLLGIEPAGEHHPPRRRIAVILNVLLPGLGYAYIRAWIRTLTGLLLTGVFIYFARAGHHPYLDVIFLAMQAIMAAAVYRQVRIQEQEGGRDMLAAAAAHDRRPAMGPPPVHDQSAQVVALVVGVLAMVWVGLVVQLRLLPGEVTGLNMDDIVSHQKKDRVDFYVKPLGLTMSALGHGWTAGEHQAGSLFRAVHKEEAELKLGLQLIPAFMDDARFMLRLRRMGEKQGYTHQGSAGLKINGVDATEMTFLGDFAHGKLRLRMVAVPRGRFAYVMMLSCREQTCGALKQQLNRSRDSLSLDN